MLNSGVLIWRSLVGNSELKFDTAVQVEENEQVFHDDDNLEKMNWDQLNAAPWRKLKLCCPIMPHYTIMPHYATTWRKLTLCEIVPHHTTLCHIMPHYPVLCHMEKIENILQNWNCATVCHITPHYATLCRSMEKIKIMPQNWIYAVKLKWNS